MCSISGILATDSIDREANGRMNAAQVHRGPDDRGVWRLEFEGGEVSLGNTRLAIIDTSAAGHQPMIDAATGNCLTYNGETYNFKDLRRELGRNPWQSNSDTEVVLHAYRKWGLDAFARLRGMFALAIWDERKHELVLARDRYGVKPLYYYLADHVFIFASELRALLASGLVPRKLSTDGIDSYLATGSLAAPLTIVEGVRQLLPGHYLQVRANDDGNLKTRIDRFSTSQHYTPPVERADAVAQLRVELEEALRLHLVSDVPLGVFLSGGMDSSALVALLSRVSEQQPKTFSVVFDEAAFTEARYSRAIAEEFQTDHREIRLSEGRLLELLPAAIASLDQPTMDGVNTFVVSQAVKNAGVTVALSGLGGDELFAGYPSFRRALKLSLIGKTPRRVLRAASALGRVALNGRVQRHKFWQLAASEGLPEDVYRITRQLFTPDFASALSGRNGWASRAANGNRGHGDVVNAISRLELEGYMVNTLLRDTDAMSMAHSLEVRVPFVDLKVVEFVLSLPGKWKLDHRRPKPLLADAVADLLPQDFLARRKMGFTLPFEKWLQRQLRTTVSSVLEDDRALMETGLSPENVRKLWQRFLQAPRAVGWSRPWSLFVLARWCEINRVAL